MGSAFPNKEQIAQCHTITLSIIDGVRLCIDHAALPDFLLMRSSQVQALTELAGQHHLDGAEWALSELSEQLHQLIPYAICRNFNVSGKSSQLPAKVDPLAKT